MLQKAMTVNATNIALLTCIPGGAISYLSISTVLEEDRAEWYPITLQHPDVLLHKFDLKVGAPLNASAEFGSA